MKRLLTLCIIITAFCACAYDGVEYMQYAHTDTGGWLRTDTAYLPVVKDMSGTFVRSLKLRLTKKYPYRKIQFVICEKSKKHARSRTITCNLTDENGHFIEKGCSYLEYDVLIDTIYLTQKDSLLLSLIHNHKKDSIPGISEVGIALKRIK